LNGSTGTDRLDGGTGSDHGSNADKLDKLISIETVV
jgi:hypothetical protein